MLDRLAQLIVDKLEPKIDRLLELRFHDLRLELIDDVAAATGVISLHIDNRIEADIEDAKKELKKQITGEIIRGFKL